jgi:hypothetical protein
MHKLKICICLDYKIGSLLHIALYNIAQNNSQINTFGRQSLVSNNAADIYQ